MDPFVLLVRVLDHLYTMFDKLAQGVLNKLEGVLNKLGGRHIAMLGHEVKTIIRY